MDWEDMYTRTALERLPWNAGGADADLVRLVENGLMQQLSGRQALDIGTGPGHDAVYLIQKGFDVIAIDISPTAIQHARENASHHGLFGFFQVGDIRQIPVEDAWVDLANDRGCFHMVDTADQAQAAREIARVMKPRGTFLLRVFREARDLEALFKADFKILQTWEGYFAGPAQRPSYSIFMERKTS